MTGSYNGFTGKQRDKKYAALKELWTQGIFPCNRPNCDLCGAETETKPHSEDYSGPPYKWEPPAMYALCGSCHDWIHKRFKKPLDWEAFKCHVARGGYGKEFAQNPARKERKAFAEANALGDHYNWKPIPSRAHRSGWWEKLSTTQS